MWRGRPPPADFDTPLSRKRPLKPARCAVVFGPAPTLDTDVAAQGRDLRLADQAADDEMRAGASRSHQGSAPSSPSLSR
jgi:hypothetical protein